MLICEIIIKKIEKLEHRLVAWSNEMTTYDDLEMTMYVDLVVDC